MADAAMHRYAIDMELPLRTCAVFFSGGKDSMLALDRITRSGYHVAQLSHSMTARASACGFMASPLR